MKESIPKKSDSESKEVTLKREQLTIKKEYLKNLYNCHIKLFGEFKKKFDSRIYLIKSLQAKRGSNEEKNQNVEKKRKRILKDDDNDDNDNNDDNDKDNNKDNNNNDNDNDDGQEFGKEMDEILKKKRKFDRELENDLKNLSDRNNFSPSERISLFNHFFK